jgi:hypothetical protein
MRRRETLTALALLAACSPAPQDQAISATPSATPSAAAPVVEVPPVSGLHLQALVATSGEGVELLLDGDPTTGWSPAHDAVDEGILLRFEEPTRVMQAKVQLCPESSPVTFESFVNGAQNTLVRVNPGGPVLIPWRGGADTPAIKSLFLRVVNSDGAMDVCEISMQLPPEQGLQVRAPRTIPATVQASSVLEPAAAYHPGYLFDGRTDFGWVEGAEGLGVGETLSIAFEGPVQISGLDLWNGYQRSQDHFSKNARLAAVELRIDGGEPQLLRVADTQGAQQLALAAPAEGQRLELRVAEVVAGSRYEDLVISELRLRDAQGPLGLRTQDLDHQEQALRARIQGHELDRIVDRTWRGLCNEQTRLTLRSNHSFVSYGQEDQGPDDSVSEVFDGAWVDGELGPPASIQTFGRRHRTETTWQPYGDDQVQSSVRISGGKSRLWIHDFTQPKPAIDLLADPSFRAEQASCMDTGTAWLEQDMGDLLVIDGSTMAGLYVPF